MIRGKTLQLRLGENINVPKISGSPIRNTDCTGKISQTFGIMKLAYLVSWDTCD